MRRVGKALFWSPHLYFKRLLLDEITDYRCILCMPYIKSLLSWIFQYTFRWLLVLWENKTSGCVLGDTEFVPFTREALWADVSCSRLWCRPGIHKTRERLCWVSLSNPCPVSSCGQKWMPKEKYQDYKEPLMIHSLNAPTVSRRPEGLPKAEIASGYLITLPAFLLHEPAGLPLNSRELLASMTCCGKELLSVTTRCVVSSETSPFIWTFYLPAPSDTVFVLEETASNRFPCIPPQLIILMTSVSPKTSVPPGWGFLTSQSFHVQSPSIL